MDENSRVLIVDDDEHLTKSLARQLSNAGFACTRVSDGAEAIEVLQDGSFDLALIDLEMPRVDGFAVLSAMQRESWATIPIVLTGLGDIRRAVRAIKLGAFDFLEKPCDPDLLFAVLRRAQDFRGAQEQAQRMEAVAGEWQATFDASPDLLIVTDLLGRIIRCNRAASVCAATEEVVGQECHDVFCGDGHSPEDCPMYLRAGQAPETPSEIELADCWYEVTKAPLYDTDGNMWAAMTVGRDISERRRSGEALRRSEERHRALFESSRDAIMIAAPPSWHFTSGNPACLEMFKVKDIDTFTSLTPWKLSPEHQPDGHSSEEEARKAVTQAMEEGGCFFEWTHRRLNGETFPATVLLTRVDCGDKAFLQATVRDISAQKRLEDQLRTSEEKFRQIIDNIGVGVALIDPEMRVIEVNRKMRDWFPDIQLENRPACYRVFDGTDGDEPCTDCPALQTLRDGECHEETIRKSQEGCPRAYRVVASPIHDRDQNVVATIEMVEDITESLQMEQELRQSQKLEAVGRLAAGIAHEINTPTQYVGDNIEFLQVAYESLVNLVQAVPELIEVGREAAIPEDMVSKVEGLVEEAGIDYITEEIPRAIEQSIEGVGRISSIVQAMKEFSHPGSAEKALVDLNQCIQSTVTVSRNEWKYVSDVELELADNLPPVMCLAGELNQVVLNMIVNASHAIGDVVGGSGTEKGTITIKTLQDGDWVEIHIADTGAGIPEEIRQRVFDPFFTTKEVGRGTGQGLAIAHNVVTDKHGGTISVQSEVGKGTEFTIRLPINS